MSASIQYYNWYSDRIILVLQHFKVTYSISVKYQNKLSLLLSIKGMSIYDLLCAIRHILFLSSEKFIYIGIYASSLPPSYDVLVISSNSQHINSNQPGDSSSDSCPNPWLQVLYDLQSSIHQTTGNIIFTDFFSFDPLKDVNFKSSNKYLQIFPQ